MKPSEHRAQKALAAILLAVAAALALSATPAAARQIHLLTSSFGAGELSLAEGSGVAINQSSGDVYVADTGNERVAEFEANGSFVRGFGSLTTPTFTAIDNSAGTSAGDVYVVDAGSSSVSKFDADGTAVASWGTLGKLSGFATIAGIAVGPSGDLFVLEESSTVHRYDSEGTELASFEASFVPALPFGLTIDSEENLYGVFKFLGGQHILSKFGPGGEELAFLLEGREDGVGLGIDPSDDSLYVVQSNQGTPFVNRFAVNCGEECKPTETFGAGEVTSPQGIAIDETTHAAYIANSGVSRLDVFGLATLPDPLTGEATQVQQTTTLEGTVNPDGVALSECAFEYGLEKTYGQEVPCEETPAQIGAGNAPVAVHADLSGLAPFRFYHYRLRAANAFGSEFGSDRTFTTLAEPKPPFSCPANEALREENTSLALPDCRAYEQVSAANSAQVYFPQPAPGPARYPSTPQEMGPATDGEGVTYVGEIPSGSQGEGSGISGDGVGDQLFARRSPGGWVETDIIPLGLKSLEKAGYEAFSSDLSRGIFLTAPNEPTGPLAESVETACGVLYETTVPELRFTPAYTEEQGACQQPFFVGEAANGGALLFESKAALVAGAKASPKSEEEEEKADGRDNIYDFAAGSLHLVNVLPGLHPKAAPSATVGSHLPNAQEPPLRGRQAVPPIDADHVISPTGDAVYWTDLATGLLYVRVNPAEEQSELSPSGECLEAAGACTYQISAGPATYQTSSDGGHLAYYLEAEQLHSFDLSVLEAARAAGKDQAESLALAGATVTPAGSQVQAVIGVNQAGTPGAYVYFVDKAALPVSGAVSGGAPVAGEPNLYLLHEGQTTLIATLAEADNAFGDNLTSNGLAGDWRSALGRRSSQVAPDGRHLLFVSTKSLTSYGNEVSSGRCAAQTILESCPEAYVYDAGGGLSCASCDPTGAPPNGEITGFVAQFPLPPDVAAITTARHWMSADGNQVFFDSAQALVAADVNGEGSAGQDVYEWEREGTGTCSGGGSLINGGGCVNLISGGKQHGFSLLIGASDNGSNAFFVTNEVLIPGAGDQKFSLYDARVGGGFPVSHEVSCEAEACKGPVPAPPPAQSPGTASFQANEPPLPTKCKKGKVKKRGKCVRKKHQSKHHKSKKHSKRTAHNNRRASR